MYSVLLVDDEPFAIQGLQLMVEWEKYGFRVGAVCEDGEEAIRLIRKSPPDLVVTDIRMPLMDGLELIAQTRMEGNRTTKFVIMSGYNDFDYARRALKLGVSHYLSKPIISEEAEDVLARVQAELDEREHLGLVREYARRYAAAQALSVLLYGNGLAEPEEQALLAQLSAKANTWMYIHIETGAADTGKARDAAEHIAAEMGFCELVDHDRQTFGIVCGFQGSSGAEMRSFTVRLYQSLRDAGLGRLGVSVGSAEAALADLPGSYTRAMEAARFLFFGGDYELVYYEDIKNKTLSFDARTWTVADHIVESMESGNEADLTDTIQTVFRRFQIEMARPDLVSVFTMHVVLRCTALYKEMGGEPAELLRDSGWERLGVRSKQLKDEVGYLTTYCLKCRQAITDLQSKRTGGTLAEVADYVRLHYRESVTIKEIADIFYINPVYLGQSFSRKFGTGILDYLHDLRIEEAMRLIQVTEMTGSSIAESLGYCSYQHFLKQFEKRAGMKPADFKKASR